MGSIEPQVSNGSPEFSSEVLEAVMLFIILSVFSGYFLGDSLTVLKVFLRESGQNWKLLDTYLTLLP